MVVAARIKTLQPVPPSRYGENVAQQKKPSRYEVLRAKKGILGSGIPHNLLLGTLNDGRLRVSSPIQVKIVKENSQIIAEAIEFNEFGFGDNLSAAIKDLQHAIVELYFTLEKEQTRLGGDLPDTWAKLKAKLKKR